MRIKNAVLALALLFCLAVPKDIHAQDNNYDPQHTVLALNMAIVSVQRILSTNDRAVLDIEYRNIIDNIKHGNIESDTEIIALFQELISTIRVKTFSSEARKKLQANYDDWAKNNLSRSVLSLSGIIYETVSESATDAGKVAVDKFIDTRLTTGLSAGLTKLSTAFPPAAIVTAAGALAASCISQYYAFQNAKLDSEFRRDLVRDILDIDREEHEQYTSLQSRLLDSSWRLLRQYHLPDEYRVVQSGVEDLFRAVNESDTAKSRAMLAALEDEFKVYPPYWVYRAKVAENVNEAAKCFDEFDKVWRPVLRNDLWKAEAEKFRTLEAVNSEDIQSALNHLDVFCGNVERSDWMGNLFAGVVYYMLGEKEKGISCVELNVNFGAEKEISGAIVNQMKEGRLDFAKLPIVRLSSMSPGTIKLLAQNGDLEAQLTLGRIYTDGGISFGLGKIFDEGKITSKDYAVSLALYNATKKGGKNDHDNITAEISEDGTTAKFTFGKTAYTLSMIEAADYAEAVRWYKKAAEQDNQTAILNIAAIYLQGGSGVAQDYGLAAKWYEKAAYEGSKSAQNMLAALYFEGGPNLEQNYYTSYVWCCVAEMTEEHFISGSDAGALIGGVAGGVATLVSLPVAIPVFIGGVIVGVIIKSFFDDYTIKEKIEGAEWFSFAKLSKKEMNNAKLEASRIIAKIAKRRHQRQQ